MQVNLFFRKPFPGNFSIENLFEQLTPIFQSKTNLQKHTLPYYSKGLKNRLNNIRYVGRNQADVNHITGDVHFIVLGLPKRKTILTIHDLGFMNHKNPLARFILWLFWVKLPVARVKYVTVISEATKKHLQELVRVPDEKIVVIPDCIPPEFTYVPKEFNTEKPVLLQIGTKYNKNLERLIPALEGLPVTLWIIGRLTAEQERLLAYHHVNYQNFIDLPFAELVRKYQECDMVTFCSTLEGFGLPILEAQATGRPVVTANISSMPEVGGEAACYVDPYNVASIRKGILKVINDAGFREQLVENGLEHVKRFEPEVVAERYLEVYKRVFEPDK